VVVAAVLAAAPGAAAPGPAGELVYASNRVPTLWQPQLMRVGASGGPSQPAGGLAPRPGAALSPTGGRFAWVRQGQIVVGRVGAERVVLAAPDIAYDEPQWSPDGGLLTFTRVQLDAPCLNHPGQCEDLQLWAMQPDGSGLRLLAHHATGALWAPNGRRIAFAGNVAGSRTPRISILDLRTRTVHVLGTGGSPLAWAPDSTRLAFVRSLRVHVIRADGGNGRDVGHYQVARWSPDGRQLALVLQGDRSQLFVARGDGSHARRVAVVPRAFLDEVAWSPDGRRLAVLVAGGRGATSIRIVDVRSGAERTLVRSRRLTGVSTLRWSRDGRSLTYLSWLTDAPHDLWAVPAAGGAPRRLTRDALDELEPAVSPNLDLVALTIRATRGRTWLATVPLGGGTPRRLLDPPGSDADPAWTPDGKGIAFTRYLSDRPGGQIWIVAPDGGGLRPLVAPTAADEWASQPEFSPDGARLAYVCSGRICIARADGSDAQPVAASGYTRWPSWAPDSRRLAFVNDGNVVVLDTATGVMRAVTHAGAPNYVSPDARPVWSPDGEWIAYVRLHTWPDYVGEAPEVAYARADGGADASPGLGPPGDSIDPSWVR
jgi:Tol biopolymer transport system component